MTDSEQPAQQPGPIADPPPPSVDVPRQQPDGPGATQSEPSGTPPYGPVPPQFEAPPGYPPPYAYGYGYAPPQGGTSGMAIAAMICGICGFVCLVPGLVGIVLGIVALPQIKRNGQSGRGMAIAGIVVGALWIVGFVLLIVLGNHDSGQVSFGTGD